MTRKNLIEVVEIKSASDELIEALLPIPQAHRNGDDERAARLLAEDASLARGNIWTACMTGEVEVVRELLGSDPTCATSEGGTRNWDPLLYLCFSRFLRTDPVRSEKMVEIARSLLVAGADPNTHWIDPQEGEGNRETALYGAVGVANHAALARLLMDAGADPNDGETAYHMVEHDGAPCAGVVWPKMDALNRGIALGHQLDYDDVAGLRKLLELGADPNGPTPFLNLPLHQAVWRGRQKVVFDLLFEHGADVNARNKNKRTSYALAARSGRQDVMEWLVDAGADTDLPTTDAFIAACAAGDKPAADKITAKNPGILDSLSDRDRSEICEAAAAGNTIGVRTMLECGWNVDTLGVVWAETAAHRAALDGHLDTAQLLVDNGADLTIRDRSYDASPLGWAAHENHRDVIEMLCRYPKRLDLRDAAELGLTDRVLELLGDGDPNRPLGQADRGVLLRAASASGNDRLVRALRERGADPTIANRDGVTAIDIARELGHEAIVKILTK